MNKRLARAGAMLAMVVCACIAPLRALAQLPGGSLIVAVTSPASGSTVTGTVPVNASVSIVGTVTVAGVQFKRDGVNIGTEDTTSPYSISWNTTTTTNGSHTLTAVARDSLGVLWTSDPVTVTVSNDTTRPTVTINQAATQADPTSTSPINFTAVFSEAVSGFTGADVTISGTAGGTKTVAVTGGPSTYNVAVSGMTSAGTVIATLAAGVAQDAAGNTNTASTSTDNQVIFDATPPAPPSVPDLAAASDSGVSNTDNLTNDNTPTFTGTAEAGSTVKIFSDGIQVGSGIATGGTYSITTSPLSGGAHSITATATDAANNVSAPSGVLSVTIDTTPPTVSINQTAGQADPTNAAPINFTAVFSEAVSGFTGADVTISGTAGGAKTVTVSGGPSTYTVAVSGMTTAGTVIAALAASVAQDAAGNTNTASTSTDNTVTFDATPPTVSITSHASGATVSGTITVTASASDNVGVAGVQFRVDDADFGAADTAAPYSISINTTTASNGSHTITAVAQDTAGNRTTSAPVTVTVANDTTAPTVSINQAAGQADPSKAAPINFTAVFSEAVSGFTGADVTITGTAGGTKTVAVSGGPSTYNVAVSGMTSSGTVSAALAAGVAQDAAGNTNTASTSTDNSVSFDATAPTVSITSPASGATVSGTITVTASAADNIGVAGVQFRVDDADFGAADSTAPYSITIDTTATSNGSHTIAAVAQDTAGNRTTSAPVTVTVFNDSTFPTVAITAPASGSTVSGTISVTANASDNVGVAGVQFQLDGINAGAEITTAPYSIPWDTTTASNGSHTLTAIARDAAGNRTTSAPVTVTVANDTAAPTVAVTSPSSGATISGTVTVTASASDNVGVVGVQFQLDGINAGAEITTAPYSIPWDTTTASNGSHTLTAIARDAAGNSTTSAPITVTVANDTTAPTVAITSPAAGATVSGTITVTASASDNVGVAGVQFQLDGIDAAVVTTPPYSIAWNTTTATNGSHTITAVAQDTAGNRTTSAPVTVTVANDTTAPTVTITSPGNGNTVSGVITLTANATDAGGVTVVQFLLDGTQVGTLDDTVPYEVVWDTRTVADGSHTLQARAQDTAGNIGDSAVVTVTVSNGGPAVTRFEEDNPAISASPADAWVRRGPEIAAFSGGTAGSSDVTGATVTFTFSGTAVSWIGLKCSICGIASVSIDGGAATSVDTAGPAAPGSPGLTSEAVFTASSLTAGSHTMVITVTGATTSGGAHIIVDAFDVTGGTGSAVNRFEENNPAVSVAGAWVLRGAEIATFSGGAAGSSDVGGATATFTFTGTAVSWIGLRCSACGIATVSVDGGAANSVDTVGAAAPGSPGLASEAVFSASGLAAGTHTLVITVTGTTTSGGAHIIVDAFDVTP